MSFNVLPRLRLLVACSAVLALAAGCGGAEDSPDPAASGAFPITIEHQFGSAEIGAEPKRVVALGYNEQDFVLAFDVVPVGAREFLGYDAPKRPWAQDKLAGADEIPTVGALEINFEKLASLEPDLILAVNGFIDQAAYDKLAAVAPTVAQTDEFADGATPWQDQTRVTGKALGQDAKADEIVADVEGLFDEAVEQNPAFADKEARFALGGSASGSFNTGADDYRTGWLQDLGFEVPAKSAEISTEELPALDADVLIGEGVESSLLESDLFQGLDVVAEDRFVDLGAFDEDFAAALGFNSPLSLGTVLDVAVPRLAAALDDDPATEVAAYPKD